MCPAETYTVPDALDGIRLDRILAEILPDSGLRLRRRLCDEGRVTVAGKVRKPGYKVREGQQVHLSQGESESMSIEQLGLSVVKQVGMFGAVYKPGGVHSAAIAGKGEPCAEDALPALFPDATSILLNRLDYLTSGLLLVALGGDGERTYHAMEDGGEIKKFYLAIVRGRLDGFVSVRSGLDTEDRKKTRVLPDNDDDPRRWTEVTALSHDHEADTTLIRCLIMKGARHQIRAHLASLGHPIVGDPLYGEEGESGEMKLHHQRIEFPGFSAEFKAPF